MKHTIIVRTELMQKDSEARNIDMQNKLKSLENPIVKQLDVLEGKAA